MTPIGLWWQFATVAALVLASMVILVRQRGVGGLWKWLLGALMLMAALVMGAVRGTSTIANAESWSTLIAEVPNLGRPDEHFTTSAACQSCHPREYATWHSSYHRTMTQKATPEAVIPEMHGLTMHNRGRSYRFEQRGEEFWVNMVDPDWEHDLFYSGTHPNAVPNPPRVDRRIVMTTGSHHQQTYWVGSRDGKKLLNVPFMYLTAEREWLPREDVFMRPPDAGRKFDRWNNNCIECHSVAGEVVVENNTGLRETRVTELGIACESCHGPGEAHVAANLNPIARRQRRLEVGPPSDIVNPAKLSAQASSQLCGQCHGMNVFKDETILAGKRYRAGGDLTETRMILRTTDTRLTESEKKDWPRLARHLKDMPPNFVPDRFWPDGMVRVSGRDHNGMIGSACFDGGTLSCLSCHSMHDSHPSDQLKRPGHSDEDCLQCHAEFRDKITEHTHHAPGSPGAACMNCHMPYTVYGLLKSIRSHHIDSPSAAVTLRTGRPDACTLCHLDQPLSWTAQALNRWYGQPLPELSEEQGALSAGLLMLLRGDANQRALIADAMGKAEPQTASGAQWMAPHLAHLLNDPYATVRFIARRSLRTLPAFEGFEFDVVGPPEQYPAARDRAAARWISTRPATIERAGPAVLMGPDGSIDSAAVTRLLLRRDDTPMDLRE